MVKCNEGEHKHLVLKRQPEDGKQTAYSIKFVHILCVIETTCQTTWRREKPNGLVCGWMPYLDVIFEDD